MRTSPRARGLAAALAVLLCALMISPGSARGYHSTTRRYAPGVVYRSIRDPRGPYRIKVLDIDLSAASTIDVALAQNALPGFETTSSMAKRAGAIAAINGDYARPSGRPVFTFATDGYLAQTPLVWGRNFAVSHDESAIYIGHPDVHVWASDSSQGFDAQIARVNAGVPGRSELAEYNLLGGSEEKPPPNACSARLKAGVPPALSSDGSVVQVRSVDRIECRSTRLARRKGIVLATPQDGEATPAITSMVPGDQITLGWSLGWPNVLDTVGGNPTLLERGKVMVGGGGDPFFYRHPRTGIGSTPDGHVLFVVVDGREPGYSVGMTPLEFAQLFKSLGADYALNLDGGGSSTMVLDGKVVNRPSDGSERPVSSALLLLPGTDPGEVHPSPRPSTLPTPSLTPSPVPSTDAAAVAAAMERDGGSFGGMSSYLKHAGAWLPRFMRRAAMRFHGRRR